MKVSMTIDSRNLNRSPYAFVFRVASRNNAMCYIIIEWQISFSFLTGAQGDVNSNFTTFVFISYHSVNMRANLEMEMEFTYIGLHRIDFELYWCIFVAILPFL